ncbi:cilia- and flagella-associated protein 251 isoform X2 [Manacus candei]|uniref:cilia- and flagella-associated protein 251 isoform X2 n=1 Tax=Manacus candei TaxID=415023 RepID=UPI0022269972|nr:cilia- and flagella-associated protein 251 isoform X2 [Manacus candei]
MPRGALSQPRAGFRLGQGEGPNVSPLQVPALGGGSVPPLPAAGGGEEGPPLSPLPASPPLSPGEPLAQPVPPVRPLPGNGARSPRDAGIGVSVPFPPAVPSSRSLWYSQTLGKCVWERVFQSISTAQLPGRRVQVDGLCEVTPEEPTEGRPGISSELKMSQDRQMAQEMGEQDPLAAAKEKEGPPEDAGADEPLCPPSTPSRMGILDTLPSTWAGSQDALGEDIARTSCLKGAGPPKPPPVLSEPKGAISSPHSGCRKQDTQQRSSKDDQHDGSSSLVWGAKPGMLFQKDRESSPHSLNLSWVFGYNSRLAVHGLMDGEDRVLLYVSSHTVVIHDVLGNRQYHLQGHANVISCLCVSEDKRWVATADRGPDALIIVWDSFSGVPVRTIFESHPEDGVCAIAISRDAKYLVTISAGTVQRVCVWRWTLPTEKPLCSTELRPEFGYQNYVIFNPQDPHEFVSNSKTQGDAGLQYGTPFLSIKTFRSVVGRFSQSVFHFNNSQVLTGTSAGKVVVWDAVDPRTDPKEQRARPLGMTPTKIVSVQKESLTVLQVLESCIVTGDVKGHIKFYDGELRLLRLYSHSKVGPIRSLSFSTTLCDPPDAFPARSQPFLTRNFILSTSDATVFHVATDSANFEKVLEEAKKAVSAIACHPQQTLVAVGSLCGLLKLWDYRHTEYLASRIFPEAGIQCLAYDPEGYFLAAGFTDGSVHILDAISLQSSCEELRFSRGPVTHISFSHNSQYLATADEKYSVIVYKKVLQEGRRCWEHLAGLDSHYKPIRSILFGVQSGSNEPRLLSLGEDRQLVEYDLSSSIKDHLVVTHRDRVEQSAVPLCLAWYPQLSTESFILTANNCYKMKLLNTTTKMCRKTLLGPTYGSPLEKMQILPATSTADPKQYYLVYITKDKVGLQILPVDGNPHKSSAFICHPDGASDLASSYDGRYIFTAGGSDCTVMKWKVNLSALDAAAFLGGEDMIPFYNLLDGGREGEFFRELEDYFYYAQICSQGTNTLENRQVSVHIPLEEIPSVMRAIGFYPSEEEIEEMINEVKFSKCMDGGEQVTEINLEDFIKLYINHRPALGLSMKSLQRAFQVLGYDNEKGDKVIDRGDLLSLLQCRGEQMTEDELAQCLTTLLGRRPGRRGSEPDIHDPSGAAALIEEEIPEEITAEIFAADILGLPIAAQEKKNGRKEANL